MLERIDLRLAAGETCAIVGPSGIGKSTLLAIAAGLDRRYEGAVTGRPARVSVAFQSARLLPWRTAAANIEIASRCSRRDAVRWLDQVGLADAADVYPQRLSVGMAQRVNLARTLASEGGLLLLDEPFSALDAAAAAEMRGLVATEIARRGCLTLLVTHDQRDVDVLSTRTIRLGGAPATIMADEPTRSDALNNRRMNDVASLVGDRMGIVHVAGDARVGSAAGGDRGRLSRRK
ncbi:ATP-binding cassette domain-containing protein [Mesorhizobium sp. BR1-1-16]|uniref:ATP-binding cassette domain-containing protein n=1 Tax=Mesorhizobium sp. BR1-1-16 TaxID=2876653 RepID=UPI001CC9A9E9|nr:ATP-binding cassette domain-containing protein [Mesorhizobium sp. BR1-1-16]